MRNRCKHGYVVDPDDPCPECERDALREDNDRLRAALREGADQITRLRAEVESIRDILASIEVASLPDDFPTSRMAEVRMRTLNERTRQGLALIGEVEALRAEVERLTAENASLASWQCEFTDGKTGLVYGEGGGTYCAMAKENARLREALEPEFLGRLIYETWLKAADGPAWVSYEDLTYLAPDDRAAIEQIVGAVRIRAALAAQKEEADE